MPFTIITGNQSRKIYLGKEKTYCDLCDIKRECIKMLNRLWACVICRTTYYNDKEVKQTLSKP
jgi:hypothetical protein